MGVLFVRIFLILSLVNLYTGHQLPQQQAVARVGLLKPTFTYLGCFNDKRELRDIADKDFSFVTKYNKTMATVELCVNLCAVNGFKVAAVQAFDECYCGNTYGRYNKTDNAKCFFHCGGKYSCGGYNANSVYSISAVKPEVISDPGIELGPQTKLVADPCISSPCLNSGICQTTDNGNGFECKCRNKIDSGVFCEERDFCASTPCYNGASCSNTFNGFHCSCPPQWRGFNCRYREYSTQAPEVTSTEASFIEESITTAQNNVYTRFTFPPTRAYTRATYPSVKATYSSYTDRPQDCLSYGKQCQNGGRCARAGYSYSCRCLPGFKGTMCEIAEDICARARPCLNNGKCLSESVSSYKCECEQGFEGERCEKIRPACSGVVCEGSGVCVNNVTSNEYYCLCKGNRAGKNCDECKPNFTGEDCGECIEGFTGDKCDQKSSPFCSPNPCLNGLCLWDASGFRCVCSEGWTGKNCSENNCILKPCLNGGVCKGVFDSAQSQMDYQCSCKAGFRGSQCEQAINPCESNPCGSDQECIVSEITGGYGCVKTTNLCERLRPCNNQSECVYSKENNTFDCRCLNGAASCDDDDDDDEGDSAEISSIVRTELTEGLLSGNQTNGSRLDLLNEHSEIPAVGFNYDNLYWILPLCLVVFVVAFFLTIVIYFGFKARKQTAQFSKRTNNIRNIHYVNENMGYDENLKPIPIVSTASISYSDHNSEKNFASSDDTYGRV